MHIDSIETLQLGSRCPRATVLILKLLEALDEYCATMAALYVPPGSYSSSIFEGPSTSVNIDVGVRAVNSLDPRSGSSLLHPDGWLYLPPREVRVSLEVTLKSDEVFIMRWIPVKSAGYHPEWERQGVQLDASLIEPLAKAMLEAL